MFESEENLFLVTTTEINGSEVKGQLFQIKQRKKKYRNIYIFVKHQ